MRAKLQIALDGAADQSMESALNTVRKVAPYADIIEAGTSFILRYGVEAALKFKVEVPDKIILADMKIMDGGYHHSAMGCRFGADIITVMGAAHRSTIRKAIQAAHDRKKEAMVDLMGILNLKAAVELCECSGADYLCVHTGVDAQGCGSTPYRDLKCALAYAKICKVAVAGGVNEENIAEICNMRPAVIIVGAAIYANDNPERRAFCIRKTLDLVQRDVL